jgi:hypothetical protein
MRKDELQLPGFEPRTTYPISSRHVRHKGYVLSSTPQLLVHSILTTLDTCIRELETKLNEPTSQYAAAGTRTQEFAMKPPLDPLKVWAPSRCYQLYRCIVPAHIMMNKLSTIYIICTKLPDKTCTQMISPGCRTKIGLSTVLLPLLLGS